MIHVQIVPSSEDVQHSSNLVRLLSIHGKIGDLNDDGSEVHLIHLYQEHLADLKRELSELRNEILTISADVSDQLLSDTQRQKDNVFEMSVKVKKLLFLAPSTSSSTERTTTKAHAQDRCPYIRWKITALANLLGTV